MRKTIVSFVVACTSLVVAPGDTALADSCRGDLYCDGLPKPCEMGGLLYPCSAGDARVVRP